MVGASDEVQLVALMRAQERATIVITVDAGSVASLRAERVRFVIRISRTNGTRSSGRSGPD